MAKDMNRSAARLYVLQKHASFTKEAAFPLIPALMRLGPSLLRASSGLWSTAKGVGAAVRGSKAVASASRGARSAWQTLDDIAFKPYVRQMEELGGNVLLHGANAVSKLGGKLGYGRSADAVANRMIGLSPNGNMWTGVGLSTAGGIGLKALTSSSDANKTASLHKTAGIKDTLIGASDGTYTRPGFIPKLLANEDLRRSIVGAATAGTAAALVSDRKHRLRNGLLSALASGVGTYGLSATGVLDNRFSPYSDINRKAKMLMRGLDANHRANVLLGTLNPVERLMQYSPHKSYQLTASV